MFYDKNGGVSFWSTLRNNRWRSIFRDIRRLPVQDYDLVINDFECISAYAARWRGVRSFGLSHQDAFRSKQVPRPVRKKRWAELILRHYAPCNDYLGFHYEPYDRRILPPVVRQEVRDLALSDRGHYVVYLPAIADQRLAQFLTGVSNVPWQVFSKIAKAPYRIKNVSIQPIENRAFLKALGESRGVLCSAGFELPAEAMHLGKKLFVIPIRKQYEQACNASALQKLGIPVAHQLNGKTLRMLQEWVYEGEAIKRTVANDMDRIIREEVLKSELVSLVGHKAENKPALNYVP